MEWASVPAVPMSLSSSAESSGSSRATSISVRMMVADKDSTIAVMSQVLKISDVESLDYSYRILKSEARPDLFPTEEAIVNVLKTMSYEDPAFASIPPYKFFDLSLIEEVKSESP